MSKPIQKKYYESHVEKDDDFEIKEYKEVKFNEEDVEWRRDESIVAKNKGLYCDSFYEKPPFI
jgi:hypothetical protein